MEATRLANAARFLRHVFIRDLMFNASIGVYPSEHEIKQRIRINIDLAVDDESASPMSRQAVGRDDLSRVVDYEAVANQVRAIVAAGQAISQALAGLRSLSPEEVRRARADKFLAIGRKI